VQTLGLLAVSAALMALFAAIEARSAAPLAPPRVLRSRALVGGNLVLFALGMLAFGMPFILTQYAQQILHWSPVHFGLASVVMPVTAAIGSVAGQALATKGHLRSIAAVGLALTGIGCLLLSQVSVDGTYFGDIFFGLLVFGPGLGATYVAGSIASLAGVAESDAGLASGLNNSSFQIGGAVGVAILSTVAVSEAHGANPLAAMTNGFQAAFATAIVFAVVGLVAAVALLGKLRAPAPAAAGAPVGVTG
jgi:predicted MFS family arabinose efflux permease